MKVAYAAFTLFADPSACELVILCGGLRMAMTAEETVALWTEIGKALRYLYADRPERCPPVLAAISGQSAPVYPASLTDGLEAVIDYARRPAEPAAVEQRHSRP